MGRAWAELEEEEEDSGVVRDVTSGQVPSWHGKNWVVGWNYIESNCSSVGGFKQL